MSSLPQTCKENQWIELLSSLQWERAISYSFSEGGCEFQQDALRWCLGSYSGAHTHPCNAHSYTRSPCVTPSVGGIRSLDRWHQQSSCEPCGASPLNRHFADPPGQLRKVLLEGLFLGLYLPFLLTCIYVDSELLLQLNMRQVAKQKEQGFWYLFSKNVHHEEGD